MIRFLLLTVFLMYGPLTAANCNCNRNLCVQDPSAREAFQKLRSDLRQLHYPPRLIQLTSRLNPRCASCLDKIKREFKVHVVTHSGTAKIRGWSPPVERFYRRQLKNNKIKSMYIYLNGGRRCQCCQTPKYQDWHDYDEDLMINRNGPVIVFESRANVGGDRPNDLGDNFTGHYSPRKKPYPAPQTFVRPKSPRVYHALCSRCQQVVENVNAERLHLYGLLQKLYKLTKDIDVDKRILTGLHNSLVDVYNNRNLSEQDFYRERKFYIERMDRVRTKMNREIHLTKDLRMRINKSKLDLPKKEKKIKICEASLECQKPKHIIKEPKAIQDISCNGITEKEHNADDLKAHHQDQLNLQNYLDQTKNYWLTCKTGYQCPYSNCQKKQKTRESLIRVLNRLVNLKPWIKKQLEASSKYASSLNYAHGQTLKNLTSLQYEQKIQSTLTDASSNSLFLMDLFKDLKKLLKKGPSTEVAEQVAERVKARAKMKKIKFAMRKAITYLNGLNNLTKNVQFPLVEGKGIPGVRVLGDKTVAALTCAVVLSEEFKDIDEDIRKGKAGWKANVWAFLAKGLQCFSKFQMMQRESLMAQIKKELDIEEQGLKKAMRTLKCVSGRKKLIEKNIKTLTQVRMSLSSCTDVQCGSIKDPGNPVAANVKSYGKAISRLEPIIDFHVSRLQEEYKHSPDSVSFAESPPSKIKISSSSVLPEQLFSVSYEIPWCQTASSWITHLKSSAATEKRSWEDKGYNERVSIKAYKGVFSFRADHKFGSYDVRIYDHSKQGKTLARAKYVVKNDLGQKVSQEPFVVEYNGVLPNNYRHFDMPKTPISPGKGRVVFEMLDSRQGEKRNYVYIYQNNQQVASGWRHFWDLSPGQYRIKFSNYVPSKFRDVHIEVGKTTLLRLGGDGRLRLKAFDALQNLQKNYARIYYAGTNQQIFSGWVDDSLDIAPGRYKVVFTGYTPNIIKKVVVVKPSRVTTLLAGGYGRLVLNTINHLGQSVRGYKHIYRTSDGAKMTGQWGEFIDLPPGSYKVKMDNYIPQAWIYNAVVNQGQVTQVQPRRPGRVRVIAKDGRPAYLYVFRIYNGKEERVGGQWFYSDRPVLMQPGLYKMRRNWSKSSPTTTFVVKSGEAFRVVAPPKL